MKTFLSFVLLCAITGTQAFYIDDGYEGSGEEYDLFKVPDNFKSDYIEYSVVDPSEDIKDEDLREYLLPEWIVFNKRQESNEDLVEDSLEDMKNEDLREYLKRQEQNEDLVEDPLTELEVRNKRQVGNHAMNLALSHQYANGRNRPVGQIHGRFNLNAFGNNARNYHAHLEIGAGSVLWRSWNNRHSVGVGAYADQHRGRFQGFGYQTKPNFGGALGYRFGF